MNINLNNLSKDKLAQIVSILAEAAAKADDTAKSSKSKSPKPVKVVNKLPRPKLNHEDIVVTRGSDPAFFNGEEHYIVKTPAYTAGFVQTCHEYLRDASGNTLSKWDREAGVRRVPLAYRGQLLKALNEVWAWDGRKYTFDGKVMTLESETKPRK